MEKETMEIIIKILADKVSFLEWQLKDAEERNRKLKDEVADLETENKRLGNLISEAEEEKNVKAIY